jgi:hypothetical protein
MDAIMEILSGSKIHSMVDVVAVINVEHRIDFLRVEFMLARLFLLPEQLPLVDRFRGVVRSVDNQGVSLLSQTLVDRRSGCPGPPAIIRPEVVCHQLPGVPLCSPIVTQPDYKTIGIYLIYPSIISDLLTQQTR